MGNLSPMHLLILVLIIVLIFGASRLPKVASSVGQSLKVFKKEVRELREDDEDDVNRTPGTGAPQHHTPSSTDRVDTTPDSASHPPKTS
ncbi:Sec-independent protein translocase subunit TatA [Bogoriella caseilytica]|uniref:Sec-independent protein translocase protein TatA n=1 Tax=Bogoriella caseilytica TaxID=56055 RepID=A0A3N2BGM0_9MICO|nr:Sec-independent protein translocase subunit TatA [Bogoriella caseilytica]ROR74402.1 sec-independent protein translocase protein TatA [Bogoriella caseilytica]